MHLPAKAEPRQCGKVIPLSYQRRRRLQHQHHNQRTSKVHIAMCVHSRIKHALCSGCTFHARLCENPLYVCVCAFVQEEGKHFIVLIQLIAPWNSLERVCVCTACLRCFCCVNINCGKYSVKVCS